MSEAFYTDKARVRASFEKAAASYDSAAVLQREVSDRMAERLEYIKHQPAVILDAGAGTGYGAAQLRGRYPQARVLELDLAHAMLLASRERGRAGDGLLKKLFKPSLPWQVVADIERLPLADDSVDMIWSNLTIQWINVPDKMFAELRRVLKPDGLLMFSTLGPDTLHELRGAFAGVDAATHVNQFIDMHDIGDALMRAGFAEPVMDMEKIVLTYDDAKGAMRDLKAIGAHNATAGRGRGLMGKAAWRKVEEAYEKHRRDGKLPASYEVVYGHAWKGSGKKVAKMTDDGRQVIEFVKKAPRAD
ncbi:malonyl-ACP O-methyltransferase BioC [Chromobacterium subtsugae]|uniref:Malonyl-[acyl-carrier protein] O-methyltransferase n=1 Tax=Chromobacterium subtsugae TaxID=251747 RepID=A0ABS7F8B0_9NEIS|nr:MULTISPECIES: malonyl-ACP O-methyltransferase BioC [Chromobacterium]KUM00415.1 malonyl-[acyl-carrier protein] O-methyltransferase BioC [Chromobacterium subtsugae]KZE86696.1 malonyl-[acyl-carrier protein] O-methyltransferase BioC [Chromobacterium sp. F49]MBW7565144.1 malonyl-ACP O-methyltransferase BioC [Chromobacterium subtsugae]MBW8286328.1 malonyl-ACP O-methyltransferase BioC [Chromobacterium subtsugae]OBU87807.1 malonyl-CoA O-methyltransferase [Chromobacterium subtsugae]